MNELATMFTTGRGAMVRVSMRWHVCSDDRGHFTRTIWGCVDRRIVDTALAQGDECPSNPDRLGIGRRSQGMRQLKERVGAVPVTQLLGARMFRDRHLSVFDLLSVVLEPMRGLIFCVLCLHSEGLMTTCIENYAAQRSTRIVERVHRVEIRRSTRFTDTTSLRGELADRVAARVQPAIAPSRLDRIWATATGGARVEAVP